MLAVAVISRHTCTDHQQSVSVKKAQSCTYVWICHVGKLHTQPFIFLAVFLLLAYEFFSHLLPPCFTLIWTVFPCPLFWCQDCSLCATHRCVPLDSAGAADSPGMGRAGPRGHSCSPRSPWGTALCILLFLLCFSPNSENVVFLASFLILPCAPPCFLRVSCQLS